jgi:DNA-binding FadR family transcriptional regulator
LRDKLAVTLARQIERQIINEGLQPGTVIGNEAELVEKYEVSRAIFREAVRLLEQHRAAEARGGRNGGLIVARPDRRAISEATAFFLEFGQINAEQLLEARITLELHAVDEVIRLMTPEREQLLRMRIETEWDQVRDPEPHTRNFDPTHKFHELLGELAGNSALKLFTDILVDLTRRQEIRDDAWSQLKAVHEVHCRIAEAILDRDNDAARRAMRKHLIATETWWLPSGGRSMPCS